MTPVRILRLMKHERCIENNKTVIYIYIYIYIEGVKFKLHLV